MRGEAAPKGDGRRKGGGVKGYLARFFVGTCPNKREFEKNQIFLRKSVDK